MQSKFLITKREVYSNYIIFDSERKEIWKLETGTFENITNKCKKAFEKELNKPVNKKCKLIIGLWYQYLNNEISSFEAYIFDDDIFMQTNSRNKFEKAILKEHDLYIERLFNALNKKDKRIRDLLTQKENSK